MKKGVDQVSNHVEHCMKCKGSPLFPKINITHGVKRQKCFKRIQDLHIKFDLTGSQNWNIMLFCLYLKPWAITISSSYESLQQQHCARDL